MMYLLKVCREPSAGEEDRENLSFLEKVKARRSCRLCPFAVRTELVVRTGLAVAPTTVLTGIDDTIKNRVRRWNHSAIGP